MSTYDFEPNPDDYGPEPAHIANGHKVKAKSRMTFPPLPEPNVDQFSGHRDRFVSYDSDHMKAYGRQCREQALDDAMNCYSPDDLASDWMDKIRSLK